MNTKYYIQANNFGTPLLGSTIYHDRSESSEKLIDITREVYSRYSGSVKETSTRYYVVTDENGIPISNTLTTTRPTSGTFIDITKAYQEQTIFDTALIDENVLYCPIIVGHSMATGMSGQSATSVVSNTFVTTAYGNNKKVRWNDANDAMIVVDNDCSTVEPIFRKDRLAQYKFQNNFEGYYNPIVLIGNLMSEYIKKNTNKNIQFITVSGATNGSVIRNFGAIANPELDNNSVHFNYLKQGIQTAKAYANSIGKTLRIPFVILINGEVERLNWATLGMSEAVYRKTLVKYYQNLKEMIKQESGDSYKWVLYTHQEHTSWDSEDNNMDIKQIQLNAENLGMPIAFPFYPLSTLSNFEHQDTLAIFRFVGGMTDKIFKYSYLNVKKSFKVISSSINGNTITLKVDVPVPPLKADTSRGLDIAHGITVKNSSGTELTVTNLTLGNDTITIECDGNPTGGTVFYKLKRPYIGTADELLRPGSYIVDSENINYYGLYIPNYLLSFKLSL